MTFAEISREQHGRDTAWSVWIRGKHESGDHAIAIPCLEKEDAEKLAAILNTKDRYFIAEIL